jgi:hypothetical protein
VRLAANNSERLGIANKRPGQLWLPASLTGGGAISSEPSQIRLQAVCEIGDELTSVPDFDAAVTLAFTERSTTPNSTFN